MHGDIDGDTPRHGDIDGDTPRHGDIDVMLTVVSFQSHATVK